MISEIIGDKHKMKRKHLPLFSGFHTGVVSVAHLDTVVLFVLSRAVV